eukprot:4403289-Pyramimonas_sp.AAC.1
MCFPARDRGWGWGLEGGKVLRRGSVWGSSLFDSFEGLKEGGIENYTSCQTPAPTQSGVVV